tara:strand:+ start:3052 stop:3711 length:660 start_codon:yes stop_codon:yes gene_type:complete
MARRKNPTLRPFGVSKKIVKSTMSKKKKKKTQDKKGSIVDNLTPVKQTKEKVTPKGTKDKLTSAKKKHSILKQAYGPGGLGDLRKPGAGRRAALTLGETVISLAPVGAAAAAYKFRAPLMSAVKAAVKVKRGGTVGKKGGLGKKRTKGPKGKGSAVSRKDNNTTRIRKQDTKKADTTKKKTKDSVIKKVKQATKKVTKKGRKVVAAIKKKLTRKKGKKK